MMRRTRLFTWILIFLIQFLLLACFIAKTGWYKPRRSWDMTNDEPIKSNSEKLPVRVVDDPKKFIPVVKDDSPGDREIKKSPISQAVPRSSRLLIHNSETDIVIGIPSIRRPQGKVYLDETLKYLIERKGKVTRAIFLVYLAEEDVQWVDMMTKLVKDTFPEEVSRGTILIITPPATIYPDWEKDMKLTLGDPFHQVKWRSKQILDAAYLMEYAYSLNTKYYLGIEDDVQATENYLEQIIEHADKEWNDKIIFASYCPLGAIGKLFKSKDILTVATYLKTFWNYKPLDWLYFDLKSLVACTYPMKDCEAKANAAVLEYKAPLFLHSGKISSLVKTKQP